jgi:tetratricopeptide (TPR) repeat protein
MGVKENLRKASEFLKQGRNAKAEELLLQVLAEDFESKDGLYLLGTVYLQKGITGLAAQLFMRVLDTHEKHFESWNNLGNCYHTINNSKLAELCFRKALEIERPDPRDHADIYNNLATLYINAGKPKEGVPYAEKCIELQKDHNDGNWNLALLQLEQGHYAEGFDQYEWGFKTNNRMFRSYGDHVKPWDGSEGKDVVVWGEQGIGDEILFASMIKELKEKSKSVVFECHPRLVTLFKKSFPDVTIYGTRKDNYISWVDKHPELNAKVATGDLGRFFRRDLETFPTHEGYLKADENRVEHYRRKLAKLGKRIKVGISWTGGYVKTRKDYRSIALEKWEPILRQNCDFISLQYTPDAYNTIAEAEDKLDIRIHHWPSAVQANDYGETAALIEALDLVITVNTSVHHLAGALGKPCWTLTPKAKAWRYWSPDADNKTVPWYPSVIQYQQKELFKWNKIIRTVTEDLAALMKSIEEKRLVDYSKYAEESKNERSKKGKTQEDNLCDTIEQPDGLSQIPCADTSEGATELRT